MLASGLMLLSGVSVNSQTADRIQQAESLRRREQLEQSLEDPSLQSAPELYEGELRDVGPQSILRVKQKRTLF